MAKTKHWAYSILALGGGFVGGLAALQLGPTVAAAAHATHTVRAEKFELVDEGDNRRGLLEVTPDGMSDLILYDGQGHDRTEYRVAHDGTASLGFFDDTGAHRVLLGEAPNGRSGVSIYGAHGRLLAELAVDEHDEANVTLYDPNTGRADRRTDYRTSTGTNQGAYPGALLARRERLTRASDYANHQGRRE